MLSRLFLLAFLSVGLVFLNCSSALAAPINGSSSEYDTSYNENLNELVVYEQLKGEGNYLLKFLNPESGVLIRTLELQKGRYFRVTHQQKGSKPQTLDKNGNGTFFFYDEFGNTKYYMELKNGVKNGVDHYNLLHKGPKAYITTSYVNNIINGPYSSFGEQEEDIGVLGYFKNNSRDSTWYYLLYDSVLVGSVNFKNDNPSGTAFSYYLNGRYKTISNYDTLGLGTLEGNFFEFYPDSSLKTLGRYIQNVKVGPWLSFYESTGCLKDSLNYGDGILEEDNLVRGFAFGNEESCGTLKQTYFLNDSSETKEGAFTDYWPNSKAPFLTGFFRDGAVDGEVVFYWENGKVRERAVYKMDTLISLSACSLPKNNKVIPQTSFNERTRSGIRAFYFPNGRVASEQVYKNGFPNGNYTSYFNSNKKVIEAQGKLVNGLRQGNWRFFNEKGVLVAEGNYQEGEERGLWRYYNKKGALLKEFVFE